MASLTENVDESVARMKEMIDGGVDSFVALNNKVALHAINALNILKVDIPNKVRIISFDDSEAFSYFAPPVTALSQPVGEIGKETVERLMDRLRESTENRKHLMMECSFIERKSH
ncbi:HTH-type transcriptional regulator KdgR [compost metagenome]